MRKGKVIISLAVLTILTAGSVYAAESRITSIEEVLNDTLQLEKTSSLVRSSEQLTYNNLIYEIQENNTIAITGTITKDIDKLVIPEKIGDYKVTEIASNAFKDCTSLTNVDLGKVESISFGAFQGCTSLGSITIPNTIKKGAISPIFNGCTNLKTITLEEGMTVVPSYICASTPIESITIPNTVTQIEYKAFQDCNILRTVNLGKIESISFGAFQECRSLESITIPSTIKNGSISPIFNGCTNLKTITLEEGMTVVPSYICASTSIESITIPNTVTQIEYNAFKDCTSLTNVDLGKVESISFGAFQGCRSLESITIPSTIKNGSISPIFNGCTNLKTITLEEGMTVVPSYICASTSIESITIPSTVTTIEANAFSDCLQLNTIIIKESVTSMGYTFSTTDTVFKNHNENLTIYCYDGSYAKEYAINNDIKYILMEKEIEIKDYPIKGKYIYIQPNTTVDNFFEHVKSSKELTVQNKTGNIVKENEKVITGMELMVENEDEVKYIIIVKGDVNCDGKVDFLQDIVALNNYRLGLVKLSNEAVLAGDISLDGKIDFIKDIAKINNYRLRIINSL